jgi:hypothetical protein
MAQRAVAVFPFHDPDPAETARRNVELVRGGDVVAAYGFGAEGLEAARLPGLERLVLVAVPEEDLPPITAKTLLVYEVAKDARWWKERIEDSRIEMSPPRDIDLRTRTWKRALSHLAPGSLR